MVEGIFDPHQQSREAVLALTEREGLRLEREDRSLTNTLLVLRKPPADL